MPLALNNQWAYHDKIYDQNDKLLSEFDDTLKIRYVSTGKGEIKYYDIVGQEITDALYNRKDGLWYQTISMSGIDSGLVVPYPMTLDSTISLFSYSKTITLDTNGNFRVDTVMVTITLKSSSTLMLVPAGNFYCLAYQQDGTDINTKEVIERYIFYYAINVGEVYEEDYNTFRNAPLHLSKKRSLTSYILF